MTGQAQTDFLPADGIFHPRTQCTFEALESYLVWHRNNCPSAVKGWVGLLINRKNWEDDNLAVEHALIHTLEASGHGVIPVFTVGSREDGNYKDLEQLVSCYFTDHESLKIDALINSQIFLAADKGDSGSVLEQGARQLEALDIPVFRPVTSYLKSPEVWLQEKEGLRLEIPWAFTAAEMQGMIEPHFIGGRNADGVMVPVQERIDRFVQRISQWINLRRKPQGLKKAAIMLHNAPCSGVEATVGLASGLDAFDGVVTVLKSLKVLGWAVEDVPEDGEQLRQIIVQKKAWSDFRWTSAADIVASGGCIYRMPLEGEGGYLRSFNELDSSLKAQLTETWGPPPGEGMVLGEDIIITGISFGSVIVMVQPKRGCHSAKCTGEVCKMLQDPQCPPPHQYLASYRYIESVFKADAIIHFGTHGNLEFLPGKSNVLSHLCWPEVVLGKLPNLYIYNTGVATEGTVAKRRSKAVTVDHLPSVYAGVDVNVLQLARHISEYQEALQSSMEQAVILEEQLNEMIRSAPDTQRILDAAKSFDEGICQIKALIQTTILQPRNEKLHRFGQPPEAEEARWYIYEVISNDAAVVAVLESLYPDPFQLHEALMHFIGQVLGCDNRGSELELETGIPMLTEPLGEFMDALATEIRFLREGLLGTTEEFQNLLKALNGGFIPPGPSGMPDDNGRNILPTGRNLYLLNVEKVPTRAAYEVGMQMADKMLGLFMEEEGRYPENVAINMLSLDISRAKGEQLSQVLYLMGIRPVWDKCGKVVGLEVMPSEELCRPRIDVTVRITGVLRDTYPHIYETLDEAVLLAARQPEPEEQNYVRMQTRRIAQVLQASENPADVERRSTLRVFGDRPGTFGAGVDLALKASAWESNEDLARTFIYFSGFAYGKNLHGNPASQEFVESAKNAEIAYDSTDSKRFDLLDSSFGASVQGGFRLLRKVTGGSELRQYHGNRENKRALRVNPLKDELQQIVSQTLLNPFWKENMKSRKYEGAAKLMQRLQHVFEWQCTTEEFQDATLDRIVTEYVNDPVMQKWFSENNAYALEEVARRYLELHQRGRWNADQEVLNRLKESYLSVEGNMEGRLVDSQGEIQGGQIEIIREKDIPQWREKTNEAGTALNRAMKQ